MAGSSAAEVASQMMVSESDSDTEIESAQRRQECVTDISEAESRLKREESHLMSMRISFERLRQEMEASAAAVRDLRDFLNHAEDKDFTVVEGRRGKRKGSATKSTEAGTTSPLPKRKSTAVEKEPKGLVRSQKGYYILGNDKEISSPPQPAVEEPQPAPKMPSPPPIVIHGKGQFSVVRRLATANGVQVRNYRETADGLKVFTESPDDFRKLRDIMEESGLHFHLFQLKEEKELKIVVRGVPQDVEVEEIKEDLRSRGFSFSEVVRMRRGKSTFPMLMISAPKTEEGRRCFDIAHIMQLRVTTEPKRKPTSAAQCYKCQQYGHVSYRCFGEIRCAFCSENHPSTACQQPRGPGLPAKCSNCSGDHPSFAKSCPKRPVPPEVKNFSTKEKKPLQSTKRDGVSFAQATKSPNHAETSGTANNPKNQDLITLIQQVVAESLQKLLPTLLSKAIHG